MIYIYIMNENNMDKYFYTYIEILQFSFDIWHLRLSLKYLLVSLEYSTQFIRSRVYVELSRNVCASTDDLRWKWIAPGDIVQSFLEFQHWVARLFRAEKRFIREWFPWREAKGWNRGEEVGQIIFFPPSFNCDIPIFTGIKMTVNRILSRMYNAVANIWRYNI